MSSFVQKNMTMHASFVRRPTTSLVTVVERTTFVLPCRCEHHSPASVFPSDICCESVQFIEATDYRSNFAETIRKLFLFFENTFQYLRGISQEISVSHFDSHRSVISANRRQFTSPILFVSFTQPCDQHDRKIQTIRKSAARWRGRRARGYRKLILRANLLYVSNIKM